jgi:rhamnulokinase
VTARVLVVDLGATSIRVAAVELDADRVSVDVLHRWRHAPVADSQGALRWDWTGIVEEVERGLSIGLESGPVASIGVDGWGVDYAFVDESGDLVDLPFAYRDDRTAGWESVARRIGRDRLYETTGVQLMGINTIFQLAADRRERSTGPQRCCCCPISW